MIMYQAQHQKVLSGRPGDVIGAAEAIRGACITAEVPPVQQEIDRLHKALIRLHEVLDVHADRISPVLGDSAQSNSSGEAPDIAPASPLCSRIRELAVSAENAHFLLMGLNVRLVL